MPPASKGDRTRERILDAAAEVFARSGVERAGLTEIAATAGLKAGSLYFHFGSRDELVAEVLRRGYAASLRRLTEAVDTAAEPDAAGRLRAAVRAHVTALRQLDTYATVVLRATDEPGADDARVAYSSAWLELIGAGQRAGVLPVGREPRLLLAVLFGAMNTASRERWSAEDTAGAVLALLGLEKKSKEP